MTLRVWACLAGLVPMLGPLAAPSSAALRYTGLGATLQSSTNGAPQAIPATVLRPEGAGPFPAIVIAHDCSGLGAHSSGSPGRWASLLAGEGYVVIIGMMGGSHGGATTLATMVDAASPLVRQALREGRLDARRSMPSAGAEGAGSGPAGVAQNLSGRAYHAFDSAFPVRYIAERRNVNKEDGRGATTGGNAAAWQDSILQVKSFFGRYLRGAAKD